jgi:hypothetical protein
MGRSFPERYEACLAAAGTGPFFLRALRILLAEDNP